MKGLERELLHYGFLTKPQVRVQLKPVQRKAWGISSHPGARPVGQI